MYLTLKKISSSEYRLDPTPESIALCDYFIANAISDGINADLYLNSGEVFIDGVEVEGMTISVVDGKFDPRIAQWWPYNAQYDNFFSATFEIYVEDYGGVPKGTFRVWDDD